MIILCFFRAANDRRLLVFKSSSSSLGEGASVILRFKRFRRHEVIAYEYRIRGLSDCGSIQFSSKAKVKASGEYWAFPRVLNCGELETRNISLGAQRKSCKRWRKTFRFWQTRCWYATSDRRSVFGIGWYVHSSHGLSVRWYLNTQTSRLETAMKHAQSRFGVSSMFLKQFPVKFRSKVRKTFVSINPDCCSRFHSSECPWTVSHHSSLQQ